jgi:hypothetical protein
MAGGSALQHVGLGLIALDAKVGVPMHMGGNRVPRDGNKAHHRAALRARGFLLRLSILWRQFHRIDSLSRISLRIRSRGMREVTVRVKYRGIVKLFAPAGLNVPRAGNSLVTRCWG